MNYETWTVYLHLTHHATDRFFVEVARGVFAEAVGEPPFDRHARARITLADELRAIMESHAQDVLGQDHTSTVWSDLLGAALAEVNWLEIANAFLIEVSGYRQSPTQSFRQSLGKADDGPNRETN